jgi:hypothetical protein
LSRCGRQRVADPVQRPACTSTTIQPKHADTLCPNTRCRRTEVAWRCIFRMWLEQTRMRLNMARIPRPPNEAPREPPPGSKPPPRPPTPLPREAPPAPQSAGLAAIPALVLGSPSGRRTSARWRLHQALFEHGPDRDCERACKDESKWAAAANHNFLTGYLARNWPACRPADSYYVANSCELIGRPRGTDRAG